MSTTLVQTSPVWIYKLSREEESTYPRNCNGFEEANSKNYSGKEIKHTSFTKLLTQCPQMTRELKKINNYKVHENVTSKVSSTTDVCPDSLFVQDKNSKKSKCSCELFKKIRDPLANYQEQKGLPKDLEQNFIGLMSVLLQTNYNAFIAIGLLLMSLTSIADGFLYLFRFIFDKCINICHTQSKKQKIMKGLLFLGEVIIIGFCIAFMFSFVIFPVWLLITYISEKVWRILF